MEKKVLLRYILVVSMVLSLLFVVNIAIALDSFTEDFTDTTDFIANWTITNGTYILSNVDNPFLQINGTVPSGTVGGDVFYMFNNNNITGASFNYTINVTIVNPTNDTFDDSTTTLDNTILIDDRSLVSPYLYACGILYGNSGLLTLYMSSAEGVETLEIATPPPATFPITLPLTIEYYNDTGFVNCTVQWAETMFGVNSSAHTFIGDNLTIGLYTYLYNSSDMDTSGAGGTINVTWDDLVYSVAEEEEASNETITVTAPNGDDNWKKGNTVTITWTNSSGVGPLVMIELYRFEQLQSIITGSTENDGSYTWEVGSDLTDDWGYKVKITDLSNESVSDQSNNFFSVGVSNINCMQYTAATNRQTECESAGCVWRNSDDDSFCTYGSPGGCCMQRECWQYDGNETACENKTLNGGLECEWDSYASYTTPDGNNVVGLCFNNYENNDDWGGMDDGCWQNDGDKTVCQSSENAAKCTWKPNGQNQNPWCYVKTLTDAKNKNSAATALDIGCCDMKGCWDYDGNQTSCQNNVAFAGLCEWRSKANDPWCPNDVGCCDTKGCNQILDQTNCTKMVTNLYMPCEWESGQCQNQGGGGFAFFNDTDSCMNQGGWYNSTGDCVMPSGDSFGGGSGGFMFAGETHCWFADNQPSICGNITGCAYCVIGSGPYGIDNSSSNNICGNGANIGWCEGHALGDPLYTNANNTANLACTDINIKTACNYGPLPNCKWTNSSTTVGAYCEAGAKSEKKSTPPVQYCEDPLAKNNYTLCTQLIENFMMPCKWQNTTYPITNCTFNGNAVFGGSGGETDFGVIGSQLSCTSAGGTWQTESYVEGGVLKQDSWCEMTGMFDVGQNQGSNNKANCDTSCWACEFQNNGSAWVNVATAEAACTASALGNCQWTNDTYAFNHQGRCDYPKEMENGGSQDCNSDCKGCDFMNNPQTACEGSMANNGVGCKWENDTNNAAKGGYCVDKTKKTCTSDCFSCYDTASCDGSSLDCVWDPTFYLCKSNGFTGEVCFNGVDDDSDTLIDCADPDCGFDNFCGGSAFGGNCFAQTTAGTCNTTLAFGELNCTWINDTWNPNGWCDMPGANCWKFNDDLAACGATSGCTNDSSSMGGNAWCEMNMTQMDSATCWNKQTEVVCTGNCQWKNNTWGGATEGSGWCEFGPMSACMELDSTTCSLNSNCSWREDSYSMNGGWCDIACMNPDWSQASCENASLGGLCQWKNMSATCQPETFMMMGSSTSSGGQGGKTGCGQYDGNITACNVNNITCTYKNDNYANNGVAPANTSGWCMDKSEFEHFGEMEGNVIDLAQDLGNDGEYGPEAEIGVDAWVDILGMGMRTTDTGFDFGAGMFNITESVMCNGYMIGNKDNFMAQKVQGAGNETTKFYWYLDTNGNPNDGCVAIPSSGSSLTGYDFLITYVSRNTSSGIVETKQMMRCSGGTWNPTNALVTTSKMKSCGEIGGVMVAVAKQDLESFSEYNKTANMKIFMSSGNDSANRTSPSDSVGPGYYTPGSIDFGFVDCSNPSNSKNPKCKNFQKFGFNVFEECKNGVDDDENGLIDCDDPFCSFMPDCNGGAGFSFVVDGTDKTAPTVMFSKVEKLYDAAFLKVDTNEPSNLSLQFYRNDSTCKTLNITIADTSSGYQANANFKPFHSVDLMESTLGYALVNNTPYYYKITVCDPSNNCGTSACSNFTTKAAATEKAFIFKIELPDEGGYTVDIPAFNKTDYNFTETFTINGVPTDFEVGIKTNTSVTKNMNMTIHCGDMAIGFFGMNILSPTKIDLSNAFVCDALNELMGMNSTSKKWNKLIGDLHLGGATDYVEVTLPVAYSASNTLNWTDDVGAGGQDVDAYVSCRDGGSSNTICKIPVSMGFSAYTITTPSSSSSSSSSSSGGGSAPRTGTTYTLDIKKDAMSTVSLLDMDSVSFIASSGIRHKLTVKALYYLSNRVLVTVESLPNYVTLEVGKPVDVDTDYNGKADLRLKLESLTRKSADISMMLLSEGSISPIIQHVVETEDVKVVEEPQEEVVETESEATGATEVVEQFQLKAKQSTQYNQLIGIVAIVFLVVVVLYMVMISRKQKPKSEEPGDVVED